MMNPDTCPNFGTHKFTYSVGSGRLSDFEPVNLGESAEDTLYRRVEYTLLACPCGQSIKSRVKAVDYSNE